MHVHSFDVEVCIQFSGRLFTCGICVPFLREHAHYSNLPAPSQVYVDVVDTLGAKPLSPPHPETRSTSRRSSAQQDLVAAASVIAETFARQLRLPRPAQRRRRSRLSAANFLAPFPARTLPQLFLLLGVERGRRRPAWPAGGL